MNLRLSVDKFCKSCIYDPANAGAGTWRQQVEDCTVTKCELWVHRPKTIETRIQTSKIKTELRTIRALNGDNLHQPILPYMV